MCEQDRSTSHACFDFLAEFCQRPEVWSAYTADRLWQDEHISQRMLELHLNPEAELASRPLAFIDRSTEWIKSRFGLDASQTVFDYGCGPGLYASRFAATGANVTGIDYSRRSIDHATEHAAAHNLGVNYVRADYLSWDSPCQADLITLIFCDLCALSPKRRSTLFGKIQRHLKPQGQVLLDVCSPAQFETRTEQTVCQPNLLDGFFSPNEYFGLQATFRYDDERVTLDKYAIVEPDETRFFYNWLQYYTVGELQAELQQYGFQADEVYANVAGDSYDAESPVFAVVAQLA